MSYFKKGSGEFIGFTVTSIMLLSLLIVFVSLSSLLNTILAIDGASAIIARNVSLQDKKETAKQEAQKKAQRLLKKYKNCKKIKTNVSLNPGSKWEKGGFVTVTVKGLIKTNNPFVKRWHSHSTCVMIEKNSEEQVKDLIGLNPNERYDTTDAEKWFDALDMMAKKLEENHFTYGNNPLGSYDAALKDKRVCNCSTYVSWALQEYGYLPKGEKIYVDPQTRQLKGSGASYVNSNKDKFEVITPSTVSPAGCDLRPGDIVGFSNKMHMAVFKEKKQDGKMEWFSAGTGGTINNYYNENKIKNSHPNYENYTVGLIIRLRSDRHD